jgi:MoxR-like ATPase
MIPPYPIEADIPIPEQGNWPASVHVFKNTTVAALQAAEATGRPLLVRGLPGVGKSETARAAAAFAGRPFLSTVIDGRTEPDDLKWRVDAVKRLSDAQGNKSREELAYVRPEALWWAYDWHSATTQAKLSGVPLPDVHLPESWKSGADRAVLLLDEIDKADPDLPNALLDVLANKGFTPPFAGAQPVRCSDATRPLIVITTNEERELPAAFLRRCLVLTLELPGGDALLDYLIDLATRHQQQRQRDQPGCGTCKVIQEAARQFVALRNEADKLDDYLPSTSEFLDLVQALAVLYPDNEPVQTERIELLKQFVRKSVRATGR